MNRKILISVLLSICAAMLLVSNSIAAENDNTKNALAKAQYMLRQSSTEKANLEKQVTTQKLEIEKLTKEISLLKNESKSKLADISNHQSQALSALNGDRQKVQSKLDTEARKNAELNFSNELLTQKLVKQTNNFDICYTNNKKLYEINKEILGRYEDKGFWAALSQKEPFTAIEKVKVENLIQDYQYEMDNLTVKIVSDESPR